MSGKCRPSLREKTLKNVRLSNLSETDKKCIEDVFALVDRQAAEVVRCKDCKHYHTPNCSLWYFTFGNQEFFREHGTDFYCAYGEREEKVGEG